MGSLQDGIGYLSKRHEAAKVERAERRRLAAEKREAERQRLEAERQELLSRITERYQKQFGWDMVITDSAYDAWGDPVYRLDSGIYITITERNPCIYRRKPKEEDPFKDVREEWRLEKMKDEIVAEILQKAKAEGD